MAPGAPASPFSCSESLRATHCCTPADKMAQDLGPFTLNKSENAGEKHRGAGEAPLSEVRALTELCSL